jgi:acetyl-CoA carboxylase carboxyl transferase subunit alpha
MGAPPPEAEPMPHPVLLEFERPILELERRIQELQDHPEPGSAVAPELVRLREKAEALRQKVYGALTPWQRVQIARHPSRPRPAELIHKVLEDFVELRGDRATAEDPGLLAGLGFWARQRAAVLAHGRGRTGAFGGPWVAPPSAAGLRKAARLVELAARFGLPLVSLIDTARDGQAEPAPLGPAVAELAALLTDLPTPSVALVLGEAYGEAGLVLAIADRVLACEHSVLAPLAPETVARLEHEDPSRARELAEALRPTAADAVAAGLVDRLVPEPPGGAHHDPEAAVAEVDRAVRRELVALGALAPEARTAGRRARLEALGAGPPARR